MFIFTSSSCFVFVFFKLWLILFIFNFCWTFFVLSPFHFHPRMCGVVCAVPRDPTETYPRICVLCTGPASGNSCLQSGTSTPSVAMKLWTQNDLLFWMTLNPPFQKLVMSISDDICNPLSQMFVNLGKVFQL